VNYVKQFKYISTDALYYSVKFFTLKTLELRLVSTLSCGSYSGSLHHICVKCRLEIDQIG
jgi:hypothetical protein